jgi:flagellar basal body-associated protein FliL
MAADEEKTTMDVGKDQAAETKKAGLGSKKLIMFGGIGLGVVVIGIVLAVFVLKPMMSGSTAEQTSEEPTKTEEPAAKHAEAPKPKPKPKKEKGEGEGSAGSLVYAVKDIIVNPAGTGGTRFLSVSFGFQLKSTEVAAQFEEEGMLVRDALITILSAKTVAQLTDAKQKEIIRYQVKKRLEQLLSTNEIEGVYFTDFVLQ